MEKRSTGVGIEDAQLVEVADHVFAYVQPDGSWYINNTGFVAGTESVVAIDACSTVARTAAFKRAISTVTAAPVTALVNTHHHGDHTFGNSLFAPATIVAQEQCRAEMLRTGFHGDTGIWEPVEWGDVKVSPPTLTFRDRVDLWAEETRLELSWVGRPSHTSNDVVVWLPEQRVLFCGDLLFNGGTPFVLMGSVTGALDVITGPLSRTPADLIVPGQAPSVMRT